MSRAVESHDPWAEAIADLAPTGGDHPGASGLAAYHRGTQDAADEERVRTHLAECPECAALILDLAAFAEADAVSGRDEEPADFETAAAWRVMTPALAAEEATATEPDRAPAPRRAVAGSRGSRASWLAAAGFALLSVILGLFVVRANDPASPIAADLPILYLDQPVRSTGTGPEIAVPEDGYLAVVVLPPADHEGPLDGRLIGDEGEESREREIWRGRLTPSPEGGLRLGLPAAAAPPGSYRLDLYASDGGAEPVAEHRFTVVRP